MNRDRKTPAPFQAFAELINGAARSGEATGWRPGRFRLTPSNGGWQVEEHTLLVSGKAEWRRVYFSRNEKDAEAALALRTR